MLDLALAFTLVVVTSLAASGATGIEGAVRALAANRGMAYCAKNGHTTALKYARSLYSNNVVLADGTSIVVFEGGCESGNDNDAIYIYAARGSQPYQLVSDTYGFLKTLAPDGTLVLVSNPGGVSVRDYVTERWNGTTFVHVSTAMVWVKTGESKPAYLPLAFAPGTSSKTVSGSVRRDFPDVYRFDARAGQAMSVAVHPVGGGVGRLEIAVDDGATIASSSALSWHGTLPEAMHTVTFPNGTAGMEPGGHYAITVDGAGDQPAAYTMTVSIR